MTTQIIAHTGITAADAYLAAGYERVVGMSSRFAAAITGGDHTDAQKCTNLVVGAENTVAVGDQNSLARISVTRRDLHDRRIHCARRCIYALEQFDFARLFDCVG